MLNGSLDTVGLPDVLRLIASSGKSGLLRIDDASPSGRVFVVDGRVAFATTRNEDDPIEDFLHMEYRADYVGTADDRRIVDLNELLDSNPEAFGRFLEQVVVEVLSRLLRVNEGRFQFDVDIRTRREVPYSFEVEEMINQATARAEAWNRIFQVVPSATDPFRMAPRLDETEDVVLARRDWALLAATGASTTINDISQNLKIFEFAAAKKVAELTQRGLIEFIQTEMPQDAVAASGLLSEIQEAEQRGLSSEAAELQVEGVDSGATEVRVEGIDPDAVEVQVEGIDSEATEADEEAAGAEADEEGASGSPTWLPVTDDDDGTPLLEELHRLHEADAAEAAHVDDDEAVDEEAADVDAEEIDGGDLATRWKNLRKAKRGVHAE